MKKRLDCRRKQSVSVRKLIGPLALFGIPPRPARCHCGASVVTVPGAVAIKGSQMLHSKKPGKSESASAQIRAKGPTKVQSATRSRTKQEAVLGLLRRPQGATIAAITEATGWQQHSVRGFFAGVVRKRLKLKLGSNKVDGSRVYKITSTDGGRPSSRQSRRGPA
jgi:hypothetical protein